mmetsp:Transcript_3256/g.5226  ORF Transcript_3256/g.5226 Transcript_3256/m.5226 type:complete len:452 (-) Transcript_3256:71-1426(-)
MNVSQPSGSNLAKAQKVPGELIDISCGREVWGVNKSHDVYRWENDSTWVQIPGKLKCISSADDGTVVGSNAQDEIYRFDNGNWTKLPGLLAEVSTGGAQHIWGVNAQGQIYRFNTMSQNWEQIPANFQAKDISIGKDGHVYVIDVNQQIWHYNAFGQQFVTIPGALVSISVSDATTIYGCNAAGVTYKLTPPATWTEVAHTESASKRISIGAKGLWLVDQQEQIRRMNASGPLTLAPSVDVGGELIDISVGTKVWGVNRSHDIYRYDDGNWTKIEGKLKAISVADDGTVVGVNGQDEIYVYENQNWRKLNGLLREVSTGGRDFIWGINSQNQIYKYEQNSQNWSQVQCPYEADDISIGNDGTCYVVTKQGQVIQWQNGDQWKVLPGQLVSISVLDAFNVFGCNSSGKTYQWLNGNWLEVAGVVGQSKRVSVGSKGLWLVDQQEKIRRKEAI